MDEPLWKIANYRDFLEERKRLLAASANAFMAELYHGPLPEMATAAKQTPVEVIVPGGVSNDDEEAVLDALSAWVAAQGLPDGTLRYELADENGQSIAVLDLAWPDGLQQGLSSPVAILIDEDEGVEQACSGAGFRFFTSVTAFKKYVVRDVLALSD